MSGAGLETLGELAELLGASCPVEPSSPVAGITTDTRALAPGQVLVALVGERFDAHDYLAKAREAGALAAVVSRAVEDPLPQLVVADTRLALGV
ncbi:MAG: Mur ligase domain-containing protein, partial [Onishia taeanensis]|uniref:Mur ligase domain-containing protein n=1 Tax=Onishia taeanensis TaxID=284577 RepID=UPI003C7E8712